MGFAPPPSRTCPTHNKRSQRCIRKAEASKNPAEAARWLGRASLFAAPAFDDRIRIRCIQRQRVPKDEAAGARWFRLAALYGNPIAQNRMAYLLMNGLGGFEKNPVKAMAWHLFCPRKRRFQPVLDEIFSKLPQAERDAAIRLFDAWETGGPLPRT